MRACFHSCPLAADESSRFPLCFWLFFPSLLIRPGNNLCLQLRAPTRCRRGALLFSPSFPLLSRHSYPKGADLDGEPSNHPVFGKSIGSTVVTASHRPNVPNHQRNPGFRISMRPTSSDLVDGTWLGHPGRRETFLIRQTDQNSPISLGLVEIPRKLSGTV